MKTAVIYARYSSDSQTEQSIEGQIRVCKEYAEKNDIVVLDTYIDRAMTGTNDNRYSFQKMIKDSNKHQWSIVLVYKLDRFSRNKYESVIHKKTLKDNGVKLVSAMENIPDTPEGTLMEALLEGFNQYYSEELTQKVNRGLHESWLKGQATGGAHVFGYDIKDKKYVINDYEKDIIIETFTKYSQDFQMKEIAKSLNDRGLHRINGKQFDEKYISYILHNKRYTGVVEHKGIVYDNIFPRILTDELWRKVEDINNMNKIAPSRKKEVFDFILTGKIFCGNCKEKIVGDSGTGRNGKVHYYYICSSRKKKKQPCGSKIYHKEEIEDLVINTTTKLLKDKVNVHKIAEKILELHKQQTNDDTNLNILLKKQQEAIKASKNIISAIEQGIITDMTKNRLTELENEISELEFEINKEKQKNYAFLKIEDIEDYLNSKVFNNTEDIKIRKLIVNTFIRTIILYEDKMVITFNFIDPQDKTPNTKQSIEELETQVDNTTILPLGSDLQLSSAPYKNNTKFNNKLVLFFHNDWFGIGIIL